MNNHGYYSKHFFTIQLSILKMLYYKIIFTVDTFESIPFVFPFLIYLHNKYLKCILKFKKFKLGVLNDINWIKCKMEICNLLYFVSNSYINDVCSNQII